MQPFIVITGANSGIGRATAEALAARGAHVVLACRLKDKTEPVLAAIQGAGGSAEWVGLDLSDLSDVRRCGGEIAGRGRAVDVLLNNAGLAARGLTKDGFELTFGTNHVGHFLLTMLLLPRLGAGSRVVNVSSRGHYRVSRIDYEAVRESTRLITALPEYEVSKLANVLFTKELARRLGPSGPHAYALHPGVVASEAWRRVPWPIRPLMGLWMISNEEGAKTSIHCATSPDVAEESGLYYDTCKVKKPNPAAEDPALAKELWEKSVAWTGADLPAA